ncbi:putative rab6 GTP-binding protein [Leptomonas seymouri]|uniref:Putative rab6 GTP-binding protein n=1 Tax=Leptomonas seymouri TaxID=5684 RepID=A0A0N1IHF1_LEPSE|nr:putative rab6 GTP-binding protein [Leptomonas seymouri]|eukprot:KPI83740.1 putative rab6 GTP-binding protein [Leptomonas seymouri]
MSASTNAAVSCLKVSTSEDVDTVDEYGFLSPRDVSDGAAGSIKLGTVTSLTSLNSPWTVEALGKEESWWASDFLLYLSWKSASCKLAESTAEDASSSSHANSPLHRLHHPQQRHQEHPETDTVLMERWFWGCWGARLRQHGGCPHMSLRLLLWGFFSGAWQQTTEEQQREAAQYALMSSDPDPVLLVTSPGYAAALEAIDRDIGRTFPHHVLFHGALRPPVGQCQLQRLLRAYATRDPEVGYCQGMAFVAAVVLMAAPEPQAYQIFCGLMRDDNCSARNNRLGGRHGMRQLYRPGFPLLQTLLAKLERHVQSLLPALAAHLQSNDVHVSMFASRWFLTLFVHQLPPQLLLRVWDFFLFRGWPVMVQVAVALLHQEQGDLLKLDLEGILLHLKAMRLQRQNEAELLRRVCNVPLL